jgi:hypothetical protein
MLVASRPIKQFMKMEEVVMDKIEDMIEIIRLLELEESGNMY